MRRVIVAFAMVFVLGSRTVVAENSVLHGAGASFPAPLYEKWIREYTQQTGRRLGYESVGSSEGMRRLMRKEVDFAGTDAFLSDDDLKTAPAPIVHIPTCIGGVAVVYNLAGVVDLRLTPSLIADIFLGNIKQWSDKRIQLVNPGLKLPRHKISIVHRSDGSGTTYIFTDYLSKVSPEWSRIIGRGKNVRWSVGLGAEGNGGVATLAKRIPGSIAYLEFTYASAVKLPTALVENRSGEFVKPTVKAISLAADIELPPDSRVLITDTSAPKGYPISGFTYLMVYKEQAYDQRSKKTALSLAELLLWVLEEGQSYNESMLYAALPEEALKTAKGIVRSITYNGEPLLTREGEL